MAQFEAGSPANNDAARTVLAAVVGLLIGGLILLAISLAAQASERPTAVPVAGIRRTKVGRESVPVAP